MHFIMRGLLIGFGYTSIGLGIVGIVLPLIPTTPLLLLGAYCFYKSSPKLHDKLMSNKVLGEYIKRWRSGEGIPLKSKITIILLLWIGMGYSIFMVPFVFMKIGLLVMASCMTIFLLFMKSSK
ncbi:YbaN family protein [Bacillus solimangrovi]|uniref:DUF454 domain-containing protein n=1 Tax=Bacillus solimangrovi TaxID=1305675 RepID=A0A1E5LBB9_9BACI|nr:YbaN family protein [Bacillus solimangrovi]OEH91373.1 hypothetical protein BFG57_05775 [Bacillus solimangrovi]